ncbi:MAG: HNH endonuclease [Deltaproteobacteria bacterium]|nr:HNH endonuclease [Deltaproteobacteria bacterium]
MAKAKSGPLTMADLKAKKADPCPLCERPNDDPTDHHLVPKSRGGKVTETICRDCHKAIHAVFSNKELETTYNTVDALMAHEELAKMIRFIAKQQGRVRVRTAKRRP